MKFSLKSDAEFTFPTKFSLKNQELKKKFNFDNTFNFSKITI